MSDLTTKPYIQAGIDADKIRAWIAEHSAGDVPMQSRRWIAALARISKDDALLLLLLATSGPRLDVADLLGPEMDADK